MRTKRTWISICLLAIAGSALGDEQRSVECDIGPIAKKFGTGTWLVYGCQDGESLLVAAARGNPAVPFYFVLSPEGEEVEIHGEGTGDQAATDAAYTDLEKLSVSQLAALFAEVQSKSD